MSGGYPGRFPASLLYRQRPVHENIRETARLAARSPTYSPILRNKPAAHELCSSSPAPRSDAAGTAGDRLPLNYSGHRRRQTATATPSVPTFHTYRAHVLVGTYYLLCTFCTYVRSKCDPFHRNFAPECDPFHRNLARNNVTRFTGTKPPVSTDPCGKLAAPDAASAPYTTP